MNSTGTQCTPDKQIYMNSTGTVHRRLGSAYKTQLISEKLYSTVDIDSHLLCLQSAVSW